MKTEQQRRLVYYLYAPCLAVIFASTYITGKYPEYADYALAGLGIFALLLLVLAIFMIRSKAT